jgi:hypothetical protein
MNPDTYANGSYPSRYKVGEGPTSPALLHTSSSHTPYPNFTKGGGVPLLFLLQNMLCVVRVFSFPFIAWEVSSRHLYVWKHWPPPLRVQSTPGGASSAPPSSGWLAGGPWCWSLVIHALVRRFALLGGPWIRVSTSDWLEVCFLAS